MEDRPRTPERVPPSIVSLFSSGAKCVPAESVVPVVLPNRRDHGKYAVTIESVLSQAECAALIAATEQRGYYGALINVGGGQQVSMPDIRNCDRCIVDDPEAANVIWQRIRAHLPQVAPHDEAWRAVGLNERLRFLRYDAGHYFKPHFDGQYVRGGEADAVDGKGTSRQGERSFVTVQIYLNTAEVGAGSFRGGATRFIRDKPGRGGRPGGVDVAPVAGRVLAFQHDLLHEGSMVLPPRSSQDASNALRPQAPVPRSRAPMISELDSCRVKYAVRTDVMYTRATDHISLLDYARFPITARQDRS